MTLPPPKAVDLPAVTFKNFRHHRALDLIDSLYCRDIVIRMLDEPSKFRYAYVDIKLHHLRPGMGATRDGFWHLDSSLNPDIEYDNYLFITGQYALTEFVENSLEMPRMPNSRAFNNYVSGCDTKVTRIGSCTITRYTGRNAHRGPLATGEETRLLIRVVKTDRKDMPSRYF